MDTHMLVLPHVLDVSVSFQPIHNFLPKKDVRNSPFILPHWDQRDGTLKPLQKWMNLTSDTKENTSMLGTSKLFVPTPVESKGLEPIPVDTDTDPVLEKATYPPPPEEYSGGEAMQSGMS